MRALRIVLGVMVFVMFVVLGIGLASADELDKKQTGLLKRVDNQLTNLETALGRYEMEPRIFTERVDTDNKNRIAKLETQLAELPAEHDDVKPVLAHLAAVKAKHAALSAKLAGAQQASADENAAIAKLMEAPEAEGDLATLRDFVEMFHSSGRYGFDHYLYARWPSHEMIAETESWSQGWPSTKQKMAALGERYGKAVEYRGRLEGKASRMHTDILIALREAKAGYPGFEEAIKAFVAGAPEQIEKSAAQLKKAADTAVAKQDFRAFTVWESDVSQARYRVVNLARVYAPFASADERTKLATRVAAIEEETEKTAQKLAETIIRENRAPANAYAKDDRKAIESLVRSEWQKRFPSESIVGIRIPAEAMERKTAWVYEASMNGFHKLDRSSVLVWVLVKDGPKQVCMWPVTVSRLHLKGDTLSVGESSRPSKGAPPNQRMLLANLK